MCHIVLVLIIFSLFCHQVKIPSSVHVWISCASAVFSTRAEELKHDAASYFTVLEQAGPPNGRLVKQTRMAYNEPNKELQLAQSYRTLNLTH